MNKGKCLKNVGGLIIQLTNKGRWEKVQLRKLPTKGRQF
jgi:hypothetical protein